MDRVMYDILCKAHKQGNFISTRQLKNIFGIPKDKIAKRGLLIWMSQLGYLEKCEGFRYDTYMLTPLGINIVETVAL